MEKQKARQGRNKERRMKTMQKKEFLEIPEVVEEIKRHCWIESEKAGFDVGFDSAAEDWISRYSQVWMEHNLPEDTTVRRRGRPKKSASEEEKGMTEAKPKASKRKRKAKSYKSY